MATFIQGVTDEVTPPVLYQPDYGFLSQVMGTAQNRYDQGFNQVKNVYNSAMGMAVSNGENEKWRQDLYKKLDTQLKSISGVDLGNQANVLKAQGLFDPITQDRELRHDIIQTQRLNKALQDAERMSTDPDPKIRAQYSEIARQDVLNAQDDLRRAKRNDGSILAAKARDFVPFEDVMGYYNEQAKAMGLKIERDVQLKGGYILRQTNGQPAEKSFEQWARAVGGNRFDRQYAVEGRVHVENNAKRLMQGNPNLTKDQALQEIAKEMSVSILNQNAERGVKIQSELSQANDSLERFRKAHPNGVPPELASKFQALINKQAYAESDLKDVQTNIESLTGEKGLKYLTANLNNLAAEEAKRKNTHAWAASYAGATEHQELKSDEVFWERAKLNQADAHFRQNFQLNVAKFKEDHWYHGQQIGLTTRGQDITARGQDIQMLMHRDNLTYKQAELAIKQQKAAADGETPTSSVSGTYTNGKQSRTPVDVANDMNLANREAIYNAAFAADSSGLLTQAVSGKNLHQYNTVLNSLRKVGTGQKDGLNPQEQQTLQQMAKELGLGSIDIPRNQAVANGVLMDMVQAVYKKSLNNIQHDPSGKVMANSYGSHGTAMKVISRLESLQSNSKELEAVEKKMSREIADANGNVKPQYAGARRIGFARDMTPIFDISGLPQEKKTQLSNILGDQYSSVTRVSGSTVIYQKPDAALVNAAVTPNQITSMKFNGEEISMDDYRKGEDLPGALKIFKALNPTEQAKAIGKSAIVSFDPADQVMHVNLKLGGSTIKGLKDESGEIETTIPYQQILSNPTLNKLYGDDLRKNSIDSSPLSVSHQLRKRRGSVATAPAYTRSFGVGYKASVAQNSNGQPSVLVTWEFEDPSTGTVRTEQTTLNVDVNTLAGAHAVDQYFEIGRDKYFSRRAGYEKLKQHDPKTLIPFSQFQVK